MTQASTACAARRIPRRSRSTEQEDRDSAATPALNERAFASYDVHGCAAGCATTTGGRSRRFPGRGILGRSRRGHIRTWSSSAISMIVDSSAGSGCDQDVPDHRRSPGVVWQYRGPRQRSRRATTGRREGDIRLGGLDLDQWKAGRGDARTPPTGRRQGVRRRMRCLASLNIHCPEACLPGRYRIHLDGARQAPGPSRPARLHGG